MSSVYKKETLIRTISFMSFFVAINVICSFLTTIVPVVSFVLIIFLPLTSAVVEVNCKDRWFPIYAFATIGLSIVVTLSSIDFTIFYIVPSIFTGYIFGLFSKKRLPSMYAIFFATVIQTGLSFAFIPLIELITGSNLLDVFVKIFRISDRFWFDTLLLLIFFIVALMQVVLSYIVVSNELRKFTDDRAQEHGHELIAAVSSLGSATTATTCAFFYLPVALLFVGISFYFGVFTVIEQVYSKNKWALICDGGFAFATLLLFALLNKYFADGVELVLLLIAPVLVSIYSIFYSFLKKSEQ